MQDLDKNKADKADKKTRNPAIKYGIPALEIIGGMLVAVLIVTALFAVRIAVAPLELNAAKTYKNAGAKSIYVITTHGLFVGDGLKKIKASGLVEKVICTNTHPNVKAIKDDFLEVKSIGELIKENVL